MSMHDVVMSEVISINAQWTWSVGRQKIQNTTFQQRFSHFIKQFNMSKIKWLMIIKRTKTLAVFIFIIVNLLHPSKGYSVASNGSTPPIHAESPAQKPTSIIIIQFPLVCRDDASRDPPWSLARTLGTRFSAFWDSRASQTRSNDQTLLLLTLSPAWLHR